MMEGATCHTSPFLQGEASRHREAELATRIAHRETHHEHVGSDGNGR